MTGSSADIGDQDRAMMARALAEAEAAAARGEVPVGAVLADAGGRILAAEGNRTRELSDPTAHAEILVIRAAARAAGSERLPGAQLWVTLEPCAMCAGAISFSRIARLVWGADDPKMGGVVHGGRFFDQPTCHHRPALVGGVMAANAAALLRAFFRARRASA